MRLVALIILCCTASGSLPGITPRTDSAVQVTTGEGNPVACIPAPPGTNVTLAFTHSMFGGVVRESYIVTPEGTLSRQEFVTENAAAAEYYATDGRTHHRADGYEVISGPFVTDDLVIRVDQRGDHHLTVGDQSLHLAGMLPGSTQVHITIAHGCR